MQLSELPYPLRLCVEMMHYAAWMSDQTKEMRPSEVRKALSAFFDDATMDEAVSILTGRTPNVRHEPHTGNEASEHGELKP